MDSQKLGKPLAILLVCITVPLIVYACSARGGGASSFAGGAGPGRGGGGSSAGVGSRPSGGGGGGAGSAAATAVPAGDCSTLPDFLEGTQRCGDR
jgi:hypothetical protein